MQPIDLALKRLDELVAEASRTHGRWGYFAVIRRNVTRQVIVGLERGAFDDAPQVAQFECQLLGQYFRAFEAYRHGSAMPECWELAFRATEQVRWAPLQLVLLGASAHGLLDYGVCAAETMRGKPYDCLAGDFAHLSELLYGELARGRASRVCPFLSCLVAELGQPDRWLAKRSRVICPESTWDFGKKLSEMDPAYWASSVAARDRCLLELSWQIMAPGFVNRWLLWCGQKLAGLASVTGETKLEQSRRYQ